MLGIVECAANRLFCLKDKKRIIESVISKRTGDQLIIYVNEDGLNINHSAKHGMNSILKLSDRVKSELYETIIRLIKQEDKHTDEAIVEEIERIQNITR